MTTLTAPLRPGTPQRHPPCTRCSGLVTADSQGGARCASCRREPGFEARQAAAPPVVREGLEPKVLPQIAQQDFARYRAVGQRARAARKLVKCLTCPVNIPAGDLAICQDCQAAERPRQRQLGHFARATRAPGPRDGQAENGRETARTKRARGGAVSSPRPGCLGVSSAARRPPWWFPSRGDTAGLLPGRQESDHRDHQGH